MLTELTMATLVLYNDVAVPPFTAVAPRAVRQATVAGLEQKHY